MTRGPLTVSDDRRLDAEVAEGLLEDPAGAPDQLLGLARGSAGAPQQARGGAPVQASPSAPHRLRGVGAKTGSRSGASSARPSCSTGAGAVATARTAAEADVAAAGPMTERLALVLVRAQRGRRRHLGRPLEDVGEVVGAVHQRVRGAGVARRRPIRVGGSMASIRSRSFCPPRMARHRGRGDAAADALGRHRGGLAAAPQHEAERGAGDQHDRGDQADDHDQGGAEAADGGTRGPVAGLAEVAAALGEPGVEPGDPLDAAEAEAAPGECDQQGAAADGEAEAHRARGEQRVVEHQGDAGGDQDGGGERHAAADALAQALLEPPADGAADAEEEGDAEEDAHGDQAEADQLAGLRVDALTGAPAGAPGGAPS